MLTRDPDTISRSRTLLLHGGREWGTADHFTSSPHSTFFCPQQHQQPRQSEIQTANNTHTNSPELPRHHIPKHKPDPEEHEPKRLRYAQPRAAPQTRAQQPKTTTLQQTDHRMMIKSTKTCPNSASPPNQKPHAHPPHHPPPPPRSQGPSNPRCLPPTDSAPQPPQHPLSAGGQKPG